MNTNLWHNTLGLKDKKQRGAHLPQAEKEMRPVAREGDASLPRLTLDLVTKAMPIRPQPISICCPRCGAGELAAGEAGTIDRLLTTLGAAIKKG